MFSRINRELDPATPFAAYNITLRRRVRRSRHRKNVRRQAISTRYLPLAFAGGHNDMKLIRWFNCGVGVAAMAVLPLAARAEATNPAPDFKEVYDLIKSHLAGETETDLNRAAVQGLLKELHAKVSLVTNTSDTNRPDEGPVLAQTNIFDGPIACFRIGRVGNGLAEKLGSTYKQLSATNKLKGVILDLRFADGHNYGEVGKVANLFIAEEKPLLNFGSGVVRSKENADAISLPVAVLVNQHTAAGAEALAAVMRQSAHAMVLGATTAGEATIGKEFPLKNGQELRIATAGVKLADGEALSANGLKPDIEVAVKSDDEKAWFADPYKETSIASDLFAKLNGTSVTNATNHARTRTTEADLMRLRKEQPGVDLDLVTPTAPPDEAPEKPVVRDPVLGRALDLIKGISVIRQAHSP